MYKISFQECCNTNLSTKNPEFIRAPVYFRTFKFQLMYKQKERSFIMSVDSKKDIIKGKTNQTVGKITDDDKKELKGKVQEKVGQVKDKANEMVDKVAKKINKKSDE